MDDKQTDKTMTEANKFQKTTPEKVVERQAKEK